MRALLAVSLTWTFAAVGAHGGAHRSAKEALAEAKKTGRLVFAVYRLPGGHLDVGKTEDRMLKSPPSVALLRAGCEVSIEKFNGKDIQLNKWAMALGLRGVQAGPIWMVAAPDGTCLAGGDGQRTKPGTNEFVPGGVRIFPLPGKTGKPVETSIDRWRRFMRELFKHYPRITEAQRKQAEEDYAKAKAYLEKGFYYKAQTTGRNLSRIWWPKEKADLYKAFAEKLKSGPAEALSKAEAQEAEGKTLEAALAYARLVRRCTTRMSEGKTARQKLNILLRRHKDIKDRYERAAQDEEAGDLLAEARELVEAKDKAKALAVYKTLTTRFSETPSAIIAQEEMEKLGAEVGKPHAPAPTPDKPTPTPVASGDAEAEAQKLLQLAKSYKANGATSLAVSKLKTCLKKYPDTKAAAEAKDLVKIWSP